MEEVRQSTRSIQIIMDRYFEIQHISHPEHPLILVDLKDSQTRGLIEAQRKIDWSDYEYEDQELDVSILCVLCHIEMLDISSYSCIDCDIHLHKLCAQLPTEMMHPSHTEHPLTLTNHKRVFKCDICSKSEYGFGYYCRSCDFSVDVKCASREEAINHKGHPHPLYPVLRTARFKCDACDSEHSAAGGVSYMCNTCNFWVHEDCASLPETVKYHRHVHPLSLFVRRPSNHSFVMTCEICTWSGAKHWMYVCDGCEISVHVNCLATTLIAERNRKYEVDADIDLTKLFQLPESFLYEDLVAQIIKHIAIHYGIKNTAFSKVDGQLISHFSHKHPLTLIGNDIPSNNNEGDQRKEDVSCIACVLPVSAPVYYSCSVCNNFVLHEWCAKLPIELQHAAHRHPLILTGPDHKDFGLTQCPACDWHSNGFSYRSRPIHNERCLAMDIKCLLPPAILHKAHKHPLKLVRDCSKEGCVACPSIKYSLAYGCVSCCFYLHHACALKPIAIMHRYDKIHPFTSTSVEPVQNRADDDDDRSDDDKYVCEFCEEDIDPEWWFHHCLDCDLSACSKCIFPKHGGKSHFNPQLTYSSNIHDHPLSYVQVNRANNTSLCSECECGFNHSDHALQCGQCKVKFHIFGCSWKSPFPLVLQEGANYHP